MQQSNKGVVDWEKFSFNNYSLTNISFSNTSIKRHINIMAYLDKACFRNQVLSPVCPSITALGIDFDTFSPPVSPSFWSNLTTKRCFDLGYSKFSLSDSNFLHHIKNTLLHTINLDSTGLRFEHVHSLAVLIGNNHWLTDLNLRNNNLCFASGTLLIKSLVSNKSIKRLNLNNTHLNSDLSIPLCWLFGANECLLYLDLRYTSLFHPLQSREILMMALHFNNTLVEIQLDNMNLHDLKYFSSLKKVNQSLQFLGQSSNLDVIQRNRISFYEFELQTWKKGTK
jgi:hypothetical protein